MCLASKGIKTVAAIRGRGRAVDGVNIELGGSLEPQEPGSVGRIRGDVGFKTTGTLIAPLSLAPDRLLKLAATVVNRRVLNFAEELFVEGVKNGFADWSQNRTVQSRSTASI